jgi:hypothetical protein
MTAEPGGLHTVIYLIRVSICVFLFTLVATSGYAQNFPDEFSSDDCYTSISVGAGVANTRVCISSTGNLTKFTTGGVEHLAVGDVIEGYQLCWDNGYGGAFDKGVNTIGFAPTATIYQPNGRNTMPLRITRKGQSGNPYPFRFEQEFSLNSRPYGPTEVIITAKFYNTGTETLPNLKIWRFFDADVNGDYGDDRAIRTAHSVTIMDANGTPASMTLAAGILDKPHRTGITDNISIDNEVGETGFSRCRSVGDGQPAMADQDGDYAGELTYEVGDILPGRVKTVEFIYRVE